MPLRSSGEARPSSSLTPGDREGSAGWKSSTTYGAVGEGHSPIIPEPTRSPAARREAGTGTLTVPADTPARAGGMSPELAMMFIGIAFVALLVLVP